MRRSCTSQRSVPALTLISLLEADKLGVFGCACHRATTMSVANAYVDGEEVGDLSDFFPVDYSHT